MLVSIITRAHNRLEYTAQCITSAKMSAGVEFEHIIVNNDSTDGTTQWLEHIEKLPWFSHVRVLNPGKNLGDMGGLIYGAERAKGKYMVQMDNDCILLQPNTLKVMIQVRKQLDCMAVMPLRLGYRTKMKLLSPTRELDIDGAKHKVAAVGFPTLFYLLEREKFLEIASQGIHRCCDYMHYGRTWKILSLRGYQLEGWDERTQTALQKEKYPPELFHERFMKKDPAAEEQPQS